MTTDPATKGSSTLGQIGTFDPQIRVIQSHVLGQKPGREVIIDSDPVPTIIIPATRPTLRFPLTESIAAKHGLPLWYFDPATWPGREPVDPADYLGIPYAGAKASDLP
jgi:hypothetical protein